MSPSSSLLSHIQRALAPMCRWRHWQTRTAQVYISKGKIWNRRGQYHQGAGRRQGEPVNAQRETHAMPASQEQVRNQADDPVEATVEERQVAPHVEQVNETAEEQGGQQIEAVAAQNHVEEGVGQEGPAGVDQVED